MEIIQIINTELGFILEHEPSSWVLKREYGYSPVQMLVSAVGSCGGYVLESILMKSNLKAKINKIECTYEQNIELKGKPVSYIKVKFFMSIPEGNEDKVRRVLSSVNDFCPVIQSLSPDIIIEKEIYVEN